MGRKDGWTDRRTGIAQPKNIQLPLQHQRGPAQTRFPKPALMVTIFTDKEDGDFEEERDDNETEALLEDLEETKKERAEDRPGRNKNRKRRMREFAWKISWVETFSLISLVHPSLRPTSRLKESGMLKNCANVYVIKKEIRDL